MSNRYDTGDAASPRKPRANRGRRTEADSLRAAELKSALADYGVAYTARSAGDAHMIRALSAAYAIASDRAQAALAAPGQVRGTEDQVFAWHFTTVLGEFAFASHDSDKALRNRAYDAHLLVTKFASWVEALEAGRVDMRHIMALLKYGRMLEDRHLADYGAQVLEYAKGHTASKTAPFAERIASTIAADDFETTHQQARVQRYVRITHDGFGMAYLNAYLPSEVAAPIGQLLDKRAREQRVLEAAAAEDHKVSVRAARAAGTDAPAEFVADTRTTAQVRADILAETLLCATPGASNVKASVSIVVPALTLLQGRVDGSAPAMLDGVTPMSFAEARQFAGEATAFDRVLTDPVTGHVLCVDTYLPNRALRRFLQIRDRTCRFPGCARPAAVSEVDHTTPYSEGGKTSSDNLAYLCRGHHVQKHEKPWTVTNLGGGTLLWQSPLGQIVVSEPEPVGPRFRPKGDAGVRRAFAPSPTDEGATAQFGVRENSASVSAAGKWAAESSIPPHSDDPPPF